VSHLSCLGVIGQLFALRPRRCNLHLFESRPTRPSPCHRDASRWTTPCDSSAISIRPPRSRRGGHPLMLRPAIIVVAEPERIIVVAQELGLVEPDHDGRVSRLTREHMTDVRTWMTAHDIEKVDVDSFTVSAAKAATKGRETRAADKPEVDALWAAVDGLPFDPPCRTFLDVRKLDREAVAELDLCPSPTIPPNVGTAGDVEYRQDHNSSRLNDEIDCVGEPLDQCPANPLARHHLLQGFGLVPDEVHGRLHALCELVAETHLLVAVPLLGEHKLPCGDTPEIHMQTHPRDRPMLAFTSSQDSTSSGLWSCSIARRASSAK
jgi:hypothetical protein